MILVVTDICNNSASDVGADMDEGAAMSLGARRMNGDNIAQRAEGIAGVTGICTDPLLGARVRKEFLP